MDTDMFDTIPDTLNPSTLPPSPLYPTENPPIALVQPKPLRRDTVQIHLGTSATLRTTWECGSSTAMSSGIWRWVSRCNLLLYDGCRALGRVLVGMRRQILHNICVQINVLFLRLST